MVRNEGFHSKTVNRPKKKETKVLLLECAHNVTKAALVGQWTHTHRKKLFLESEREDPDFPHHLGNVQVEKRYQNHDAPSAM